MAQSSERIAPDCWHAVAFRSVGIQSSAGFKLSATGMLPHTWEAQMRDAHGGWRTTHSNALFYGSIRSSHRKMPLLARIGNGHS